MAYKMGIYDHISEALDKLSSVRDSMMSALEESQKSDSERMTVRDFDEINALEKKLMALQEKYAPAYEEFTWDAFMAATERIKEKGQEKK